jgi:hypothetical protein
MSNSVENVRKLLDVISMKRRDLTKYHGELKSVKNELTLLLERDTRYRSSNNINLVNFQENNINIIDLYAKYLDVLQKYNKTKQTVEHLENVIGTYNINHIITDIKNRFEESILP